MKKKTTVQHESLVSSLLQNISAVLMVFQEFPVYAASFV